jgi:hypothetical protein
MPDGSGDNVRRWLVLALALVLLADAVGGVISVITDVNTWGEAWSTEALLAAPWPMCVAQVLLTWLAVRRESRLALVAAGLLALACLVSVISGFIDGGLGNDELAGWMVAYQGLLLTVTGILGLVAAARGLHVLRTLRVESRSKSSSMA